MFNGGPAPAEDILETVDVPILALDGDLRVEVVNDAFTRLFQVQREEALGQFIYELGNGQWDIPELRRLLTDVITRHALIKNYRVEHTFERIGRRVMRLNAKSIERQDAGVSVLLAIADDTERERLQSELEGRIEFADKLIDSVRESLLILDLNLRVHSANQTFYELFRVDPEETVGQLVFKLGNEQWDIPELRRLLEDILPKSQTFDDYEVCHSFETIGPKVMLLNGRRLDHLSLIVLAIRDVTEQREMDRSRIERERRQAFLLELNDATRPIQEPVRVQTLASERLGQYLEVGQVAYVEIDHTGTWASISRDWNDGTLPSNAGRHHLADFGQAFIDDLKCGRTVAIGDVARDLRTSAPQYLQTFKDRCISAFINVPLIKEGRLVAVLAAHSRAPRRWRPSEVSLAEEVAERTWSAVERALTEEALRDSELRHRTLVRAASAVTWSCPPSGLQVEPQPEWAEFTGQSTEEMLGAGWMKAVHPDDIPEADMKWKEAVARMEPFVNEQRIRRHDGEWRWMSIHAVPVRDANGTLLGWYGMNIDISERKEAETKLAQREAEARAQAAEIETIYASAPVGLCVIDRDLRYRRINERLAAINGVSAAAHIGKTIREIVPSLADVVERVAARVLETGEPVLEMEISGETPSQPGERNWIEHWLPLHNAYGEIAGINIAVEEITERKRAERELRESKALLSTMFESLPVGVAQIDAEGRVVLGNAEMYRLLPNGVIPSRDEGNWQARLKDGTALAPGDFPGARALSGEPVVPGIEMLYTDRGGHEVWINLACVPIRDADGHIEGAFAVASDITERKRAEERERMLMREVNHRAKNMLAVVQSIAQLTAAESPQDFVERFAKRIRALSDSQDVLVKCSWHNIPLDALIRSQLSHFAHLIGERIQLSGPPIEVRAAAAQAIGMAMHELATNAAKYGSLSNAAGLVLISWRIVAGGGEPRFELSWRETGGPPVEVPVRRGFGSKVTTSLVKMSVGGEVETRYEPGGLFWELSCPAGMVIERGSTEGRSLPVESAKATRLRSERVLVVEDEPLIALEVAQMLETAGFEVVGPAASVDAALKLIDIAGCDAAILDVNLGQQSAEPIASRLARSKVPFVAMSGYSREQLPAGFGSVYLLSKPVQGSVLVDSLRRCLGSGERA